MRKGLAILLAAISIIALVTAASAAPIYEESVFTAALAPGYYLEDFGAYSYGTPISPPQYFGPVNGFSYQINTASGDPGSLFPLDGSLSVSFNVETLLINFFAGNTTVNAVGGFFFPTDDGGNSVAGSVFVSFNGGAAQEVTSTDPLSFLGFLSDTPITSISIYSVEGNFPTLDHLYVGTQAVPLPPSVLLLGSGLLSLGLLGWRRQNG
jgi:hypothetical protein